jgi:hypothetical protein
MQGTSQPLTVGTFFLSLSSPLSDDLRCTRSKKSSTRCLLHENISFFSFCFAATFIIIITISQRSIPPSFDPSCSSSTPLSRNPAPAELFPHPISTNPWRANPHEHTAAIATSLPILSLIVLYCHFLLSSQIHYCDDHTFHHEQPAGVRPRRLAPESLRRE